MRSKEAVPFADFGNAATAEDEAAVRRVLASGRIVLGEEVSHFENTWAERCGLPFAVGVGNGLDAIEIGLRSLGLGPGDEVITTPMTAVATVLGIMRAGATPVLADVEPSTALMSLPSVARCVTPRTRAVLLVHLYGQMRDLSAWSAFCEDHGLLLIEDCAQSHDALSDGKVAGAWGAFGAYSFYPTKNLGAVGDAGALVTNDLSLCEAARSLRNYGQKTRYVHGRVGLNSRLDEVQAAILNTRLGKLTSWTQRRRQIAEIYRAGIRNDGVELLASPVSPESHVYHLFVIRSVDRDRLQQYLLDAGVETLIHYPIPVHRQTPFHTLSTDPVGLPSSDEHAERCLSLPCRPNLSDTEVNRVIEAINSFQP